MNALLGPVFTKALKMEHVENFKGQVELLDWDEFREVNMIVPN